METPDTDSISSTKLEVRKLKNTDKSKGFDTLLEQLTHCPPISDEEFKYPFTEISAYGDNHLICVIEDTESEKIVATRSVFIENKVIRNCGKVGHIEDVIVDANARGKNLGKMVIEFLSEHAKKIGCYKVILDCSEHNRVFYENVGLGRRKFRWLSILFSKE